MNWYVYILLCRDQSYYVGITNDIEKRVNKHNSGVGSIYLLSKLPVRLVYSEKYENKSQARIREIQLKGWTREKKRKLIEGRIKDK